MYQQIASNKRRTLILMVGFVAFIWAVAWVIALASGRPALIYVIGVAALLYAVIGYYASASVALALSGAQSVTKQQAPELYRIVENLAIASGLPMPQVYVINDASPNAFATGRDPQHAVVAVTTGLLDIMNKSELEGVIAHELSHVGNYDTRLMAIVIVLVTIVTFISHFFLRMTFWGGNRDNEGNQAQAIFLAIGLVLAILSPIIAALLQLAVSRKREYLADASGALLTRYPEGLASALAKIDAAPRGMRKANSATAHLYIASPFKNESGLGGWLADLFSTHPPIKDRINRLEHMEANP